MPRPHQSPPRRAVAPGRTGPAETVPEAQDPSARARRRPPWSSSPGASSSPRRVAFVPRAGALVPASVAVAISLALFSPQEEQRKQVHRTGLASEPLIASLFPFPEGAKRAVFAHWEVLTLLVGQPMFPSLIATDLTPCALKNSMISRWIF